MTALDFLLYALGIAVLTAVIIVVTPILAVVIVTLTVILCRAAELAWQWIGKQVKEHGDWVNRE